MGAACYNCHQNSQGEQEIQLKPTQKIPSKQTIISNNDSIPLNLQDEELVKNASVITKFHKMQMKNMGYYEGEWLNGMRHGQGIYTWSDNTVYTGQFQNDLMHGKGQIIHPNGDIYEGDWANDLANGFGIFKQSNLSIECNFQNIFLLNILQLIFYLKYYFLYELLSNDFLKIDYKQFYSNTYTGQWKDDLQHGEGIEEWPQQIKYEGQYVKGKKHGRGKIVFEDGSRYDGEFINNQACGNGEFYWQEGKYYKGQWKDNQMNGKGEMFWPDGKHYVGDYENDKKHGQGQFTWENGKVYIGGWYQGKQHGKGYIIEEGIKRECIFENGRLVNNN